MAVACWLIGQSRDRGVKTDQEAEPAALTHSDIIYTHYKHLSFHYWKRSRKRAKALEIKPVYSSPCPPLQSMLGDRSFHHHHHVTTIRSVNVLTISCCFSFGRVLWSSSWPWVGWGLNLGALWVEICLLLVLLCGFCCFCAYTLFFFFFLKLGLLSCVIWDSEAKTSWYCVGFWVEMWWVIC